MAKGIPAVTAAGAEKAKLTQESLTEILEGGTVTEASGAPTGRPPDTEKIVAVSGEVSKPVSEINRSTEVSSPVMPGMTA